MHASIASIADLYRLNGRLFEKIMGDIKDSDLAKRPLGKANSAHFIVGHLVVSRFGIAGMIGLEGRPDLKKLFGMGAKDENPSAYPPMSELMSDWKDVSEKMLKRLGEMTEAELAAAPPFEIPGVEKSVRGCINFLVFHESYHVGQLAYIARLHGGEQLFG
jgi:uncharacterized damage-inducible protein DinB